MNLGTRPTCITCDNPDVFLSFSFTADCLEYLPDGRLIVYYYCTKCDTEFQTVYIPQETNIVSEE